MTDLYRTCSTCNGSGDVVDARGLHDQCMTCSAWGVEPVTIDYETAAVKVADYAYAICADCYNRPPSVLDDDREAARRIVDAAFGEGQ